jgi:hypothetical protein
MRYVMVTLVLPFAFLAAGCGASETRTEPKSAVVTVPDVTGENLDSAEDELDSLGIGYSVDSGDDEVLFEHLWEVCYQDPGAGARARFVTLTVEHVCDGD